MAALLPYCVGVESQAGTSFNAPNMDGTFGQFVLVLDSSMSATSVKGADGITRVTVGSVANDALYQTLTAVKNIDHTSLAEGQRVTIGGVYRSQYVWVSSSTLTEDLAGFSVIRCISSSVGRFIKVLRREHTFSISGPFAGASGAFDPLFYPGEAEVLTGLRVSRDFAGASGSTVVDVLLNGVSLYANPGDRPTITAASGNNVVVANPFTNGDVNNMIVVPLNSRIEVRLVSTEAADADGPSDIRGTLFTM